ncbi:MAG: hypothetical protein Q4E62_04490 [Sutterellaceae bacterium]|nr:hypothetical protein [Sutterellaceae bacterium]
MSHSQYDILPIAKMCAAAYKYTYDRFDGHVSITSTKRAMILSQAQFADIRHSRSVPKPEGWYAQGAWSWWRVSHI